MSNKLKVFLLGFLLVCTGGFCGNLHVFYEQNGDCFVLVGNGDHRGVYALNNLTTDSYNYMYDPKDAYGISAGQWWKGTSNETSSSLIEKRLYTFYAINNDPRSLTGTEVRRRVIPRGDSGVYGYDPPYIVHRAHSGPRSSPTGLGNHTYTDYCQSLTRFFTPSDIPCTEVPVSAGKDAAGNDLYWVTAGVDWYHDRTENVYSNWAYGSGGWCHRVSKDFLTEYTRDINLDAMNINNKTSPVRDSSLCSYVARVTTGTDGYKSTLGECVDGCIRAQPAVNLPPDPEPIVRFVYSSQVKKSYLYNRPFGETSYTLLGQGSGDVLVGKPKDLTCNFIGISTKNSSSNYVYLLGSKVINEWFEAANCPSRIDSSDDLACVAVSDQWWQTGGIVYAYDSKKGKVYSFVRVEGGKSGYPDEINVNFDGRKPDKIGTDGFGNLYVLKTELDPPNTNNFGKDGTENEKKYIFTYNGQKHFVAIYRQKIYKTVYKRPYGLDTSFSKINQRIPLGVNEYEREFTTDDDDINSKKTWWSSLQQTKYDGDGSNIRTELAVINVPTPPEPSNVEAIADCFGPVEQDEYYRFVKAEPDNEDGSFSSTRNIFFIVENAPEFDANGVNYNGSTEDKDKDGTVGCFPNTIKESSIVYHWKIVKTKDQLGRTINPGDPDYVVLDTTGDNILLFPSLLEGEFDVGVKVEYRYYDYTKLKVGALASEKETCLTPKSNESPKVAVAGGRKVRDGYSWEHIKQTWRKPPVDENGYGIIMSSLDYKNDDKYKPIESSEDSKLTKTEFVMDGISLCKIATFSSDTGNKVVAKYDNNIANWGLKLRETKTNKDKGLDRINILMKDEPPKPDDPNLIDDTLKWSDELKVSWKSVLKRGDETIWQKDLDLKNFNLTLEQLRELMPMPSDPLRYVITAYVYRTYRYDVYVKIPTRKISDTEWEYTNRRSPVVVNISIEGEAEICVTDNTGPSLYQYDALDKEIATGVVMIYAKADGSKDENTNYIKASTGETIGECPNKDTLLVFYVCDNNPMSNYAMTKVVESGTKDKYHIIEGKPDALKTSFNKNDSRALLHYETAFGVMPDIASGTMPADEFNKYIFQPEPVTDVAELKSVNIIRKDKIIDAKHPLLLSYVKYKIPVSCMKHFNDGTGIMAGLGKARLPFNIALNSKKSNDYKVALSWQESCNASYNCLDNLGEVINLNNSKKEIKNKYYERVKLNDGKYVDRGGRIVVKDNDRPNIFIRGFQDRYPEHGDLFMVPTLLASSSWFNNNGSKVDNDQWFLTTVTNPNEVKDKIPEVNNGSEVWDDEKINFNGEDIDIKSCFNYKKPEKALITIFRNEGVNADYRLLTDVPVSFKYVMMDNAGEPTAKLFNLYNYDTKEKLVDGLKDGVIQYVFRKAGKYYVELQVEDDAIDWPINWPTNKVYEKKEGEEFSSDELDAELALCSPKHQNRTLRAYFEVIDSKLEYRVLERDINKDY